MLARPLLAVAFAAGLIGCDSPEVSRTRGGGPGADVGNRGRVDLHGRSEIYYQTPLRISELARGGAPGRPGSPSK
jgi:hypothetical protein